MSLNLSDEEIHGPISYARGKFAAEPYPFAPALRPIREALAKIDPKPTPAPLPPRRPLRVEPSAAKEKQAAAIVSNRGSITLSELQRLDLLEIKCHRCERHGRVSLERPIEEHGADTGLPDLWESLAGDCPNGRTTG